MTIILKIVLIVLAYLSGSIPFGYVLGKRRGIDIRKYGSGNIGTSNVVRTLGKKAALMTLLGDGFKGLIPVLLTRVMLPDDYVWSVIVGLAAIAGHNWPIYLKFKGGKGVTTTYGAFLGIALLPALATIGTWILITYLSKQSSIAALISAPCAPLYAYLFGVPAAGIWFALIGAVLIYIKHITNIQRLLKGTEIPLTQKADMNTKE